MQLRRNQENLDSQKQTFAFCLDEQMFVSFKLHAELSEYLFFGMIAQRIYEYIRNMQEYRNIYAWIPFLASHNRKHNKQWGDERTNFSLTVAPNPINSWVNA